MAVMVKKETQQSVTEWMSKAVRDLDTAEYLFQGKRYEECSLFCQQATEKMLKAVLIHTKQKIIKTHDIYLLVREAGAPAQFEMIAKELSLIYIVVRYPDAGNVDNIGLKARKYMGFVKEVLQWVKKQI